MEERGDKLDNWAYQWWLEDMYLDNMAPLPVNSSPGWVLPRKDFKGKQENMVKYLAGIINGLTEFKTQLERWVVCISIAKEGSSVMSKCNINCTSFF